MVETRRLGTEDACEARNPGWKSHARATLHKKSCRPISDFLEAEDTIAEKLRFSLSSRYECLCLQVLDPDEIDLPEGEALRFAELEGKREVSTSPPAIREKYKKDMSVFCDDLQSKLSSVSAEFESLVTNQDLGHALRRFLGMRNRQ